MSYIAAMLNRIVEASIAELLELRCGLPEASIEKSYADALYYYLCGQSEPLREACADAPRQPAWYRGLLRARLALLDGRPQMDEIAKLQTESKGLEAVWKAEINFVAGLSASMAQHYSEVQSAYSAAVYDYKVAGS